MSSELLSRLDARWEHLRGAPGTRRRRAGIVAEVVVVGLLGLWLGLLAGGRLDAGVGPLQTHLTIGPSLDGGSEVGIPPLGELTVDTHAPPWKLTAQITRINAGDARRIFSNPAAVNGLGEAVANDLTGAIVTVALRAAMAGVAGGLLLGLMVFRRRFRLVAASGTVSLAVVIAGGGAAWATWDPESINEPQYTGLLASAPAVVGDAQSIVRDFQRYEDQLAKLVTNVSRLYDVTSTLAGVPAGPVDGAGALRLRPAPEPGGVGRDPLDHRAVRHRRHRRRRRHQRPRQRRRRTRSSTRSRRWACPTSGCAATTTRR